MTEATMTALRDAILEAVHAGGDEWQTRKEIGERLNRPAARLNPYDIQLLTALAADGTIEAKQQKIATVKTEWVYRAKGE